MSDRELDNDLFRGNLIATRAMLTAILAHIGKTDGDEVLRRLQVVAREHVERAERRMHAEAETPSETDTAKEVISCAEGFMYTAFTAAFETLD